MGELDWSQAPIHQEIKRDWKTPEILIEGSLNCGKSTVGFDKEIDATLKWAGIPILMARWTQDAVDTKLRPAFEEILAIRDLHPTWDAKEKYYEFENKSRVWMFGLKAVSQIEMFSKIRGLGVCRILLDQAEEADPAVAAELRGRLRPSLTGTVNNRSFPFQLTFIANPEDFDFWLSREFPLDNHIKGRKVFSLSIFDNPYLPEASRESLLRTYAVDHPKFTTMVMGQRGANIVGEPIFGSKTSHAGTKPMYNKTVHHRPIPLTRGVPIYEAFHVGEHNPTWVYCQPEYAGGLVVLGGVRGEGLLLEDFLPIVHEYRSRWYGSHPDVKTAIAPMGEKDGGAPRYTPIRTIKEHFGVAPIWKDNANAPDVQLGMIEELGALMRRRNPSGDECFGVNDDPSHFVIVNADGPRESPFVHHAFEAGAVWSEKTVSIANKDVKQIRDDDKFSNVIHAVSNVYLNFCAGRPTLQEAQRKKAKGRPASGIPQPPAGGRDSWMAQ